MRQLIIINDVRKTNLQLIASQIESAEDTAIMWKSGIHMIQGKFIQVPIKAMDLLAEN